MNAPTADYCTPDQLADLRRAFDGLLTDTEVGAVSFTFEAREQRGGVDFAAGLRLAGGTRTAIVGVLTPITRAELDTLKGAQVGDVTILVSTSELATAPAPDDSLWTSERRYHVVSAELYGLGTHYRIVAREA